MRLLKVHVVSADSLVIQQLREVLIALGCMVTAVSNTYEEGLLCLKKGNVDLVFIGLDLGSFKSGIDLAKKIRSSLHLPFIYISSGIAQDLEYIDDIRDTMPWGYSWRTFFTSSSPFEFRNSTGLLGIFQPIQSAFFALQKQSCESGSI